MAKTKTKKAEVKKAEVKKFEVFTVEKSIIIDTAKNEKEAESIAEVLLLQHGEYSNDNPPVIIDVKEIE